MMIQPKYFTLNAFFGDLPEQAVLAELALEELDDMAELRAILAELGEEVEA